MSTGAHQLETGAAAGGRLVLRRAEWDAALFDLDGVLTQTAELHRQAWKEAFDGFLSDRAQRRGEPFRPFDGEDYLRFVDGRRRLDGVRAFLESRGIRLRPGDPADVGGTPTEHGIANEKNERYLGLLQERGAAPFEEAVGLVCALRAAGIRTAVVSASRNCGAVLEAAGIEPLFEATVDGNDLATLRLRGKPAPDAFLEAARRLGARPARTLVVEDALAGVAAARAGGFGLVIGVARASSAEELRRAGAHLALARLDAIEASAGAPG